ncbi:MAG TPA: SDR family oxidoreductase [Candidatus Polarisedimenticolaceae bacterium]|nr:SDR family oxidoreductase [Candidatus Polarisedimenticolaceae bacterium]
MEHPLKGKVIVITGASSGFGKGAARQFAREGAWLALAARRGHLLDALAAECEQMGARAASIPTNVADPTEVEALAEAAIEVFGRIDVWVNNAGVGALGRFADVPLEEHIGVVETTLMGTVYGSWFAMRQFLRQGSGVLINIASELGKTSVPYYGSYTAAKHGVVGLSTSLRQELDQNEVEGVHVCTILPTAHDTPFFDHAANHTGHEVQAPAPLHEPDEVVDAIVALARNPKDEKIVGGDGFVKFFVRNVAPGLGEKMGAVQMHKAQIEKAPPAPDSPGAVLEPMEEGTEVKAGRLPR